MRLLHFICIQQEHFGHSCVFDIGKDLISLPVIEGLFGHELHFYLEHKLEVNKECPHVGLEGLLLLLKAPRRKNGGRSVCWKVEKSRRRTTSGRTRLRVDGASSLLTMNRISEQ